MFTGLIEELGVVKAIRMQSDVMRLSVSGKAVMEEMKIGDSIALNGACITVVEISGSTFSADISRETRDKTNLCKLKVGDKVNLERPMMLSDRLGGHLVTGHIDAVGVIRGITKRGNESIFTFEAPRDVQKYLVSKGSVAVDGISLTVNEVQGSRFTVTIIPHTVQITTLGFKKVGDIVNLEADIIGKYVEKLL